MPVNPSTRAGKGAFSQDAPASEPDPDLLDKVIQKAESRTVFLDYLQMIMVGFLSAIKGLFRITGSTNVHNDKSEN